jgi:hypothetical protein
MVNSIHSAAAATAYHTPTQQPKQSGPPKQAQAEDTVTLSKQATGSVDADHDGDSH